MASVKTEIGIIRYTPKPLFFGRKPIDKEIAKENLLDFKRVADQHHLNFGLIYGTLLGAVRERDFIEHDEDIDLFVLEEDKNLLLNLIFELRQIGFEIARYDRRGLLSIIRNNEYIDFYIFSKFKQGVRTCCGECVIESFLLNTTQIEFLSGMFVVPLKYVEFLEFQYGTDWKTPVIYANFNKNSKIDSLMFLIKEYIKIFLPDCLFYKFVGANEKQFIKSFYQKLETSKIQL